MLDKMNHFIAIEKPLIKKDDFGGTYVAEWVREKCVWAAIDHINNLSLKVRSKNFSHQFLRITVRKQVELGLDMRVVYKGNIFYIEQIVPSKFKGYKEIIVYEKVKYEHSS